MSYIMLSEMKLGLWTILARIKQLPLPAGPGYFSIFSSSLGEQRSTLPVCLYSYSAVAVSTAKYSTTPSLPICPEIVEDCRWAFSFFLAPAIPRKAADCVFMNTGIQFNACSSDPCIGSLSPFRVLSGITFLPVTEKNAVFHMMRFSANAGLPHGAKSGADPTKNLRHSKQKRAAPRRIPQSFFPRSHIPSKRRQHRRGGPIYLL